MTHGRLAFVAVVALSVVGLSAARKPQAPGNLIATAVSISVIDLSWSDRALIETGYAVQRCTVVACTSFATVATLPTNTIHWTDSSLNAATVYCYRVRSFTDRAVSQWSNVACATTLGTPAPVPIPPPIPPVVDSVYGPQASIACPLNATPVSTTADLQALVNASPSGSAFCLLAGIHSVISSVTPKSGDSFTGEYGAILDGSGWTTTDDTAAAFRAHNQDIDDVTIRNLEIRNMPQRGIHAFSSYSDHWTIDHNDIHHVGRYGVSFPSGAILRDNFIHDNPFAGYASYLSNNVLIEHNEIARNGGYGGQGEQKIVYSVGTIFRNNYIHDNVGIPGIWYDGENTQSLVEGNTLDDNTIGVMDEVSGSIIIRNNVIRRSADHGIFISTSHDAEAYGNTLEDNYRGILTWLDCGRLGQGGTIGEVFAVHNNNVHDNTVTISTQPYAFGNGFASTACTADQLAPYLNGSMGITFQGNHYAVPIVGGAYWWFGDGLVSWSAWQAIPQDATGTVQQR